MKESSLIIIVLLFLVGVSILPNFIGITDDLQWTIIKIK